MNISKRRQVLLLASGIVLFALLLQLSIVIPLQEERKLLSADIQDDQSKSDLLDSQIETLLQNSDRGNSLAERGLADALFSKNSSIELITRIENLATAYHIQSELLFEGDIDRKQSGLQEIPTTIRGKGTFLDLLRFVRALEQEPLYINADSIRLLPASTLLENEHTLELTFNATTTWK